jgi:hypothetical protein
MAQGSAASECNFPSLWHRGAQKVNASSRLYGTGELSKWMSLPVSMAQGSAASECHFPSLWHRGAQQVNVSSRVYGTGERSKLMSFPVSMAQGSAASECHFPSLWHRGAQQVNVSSRLHVTGVGRKERFFLSLWHAGVCTKRTCLILSLAQCFRSFPRRNTLKYTVQYLRAHNIKHYCEVVCFRID